MIFRVYIFGILHTILSLYSIDSRGQDLKKTYNELIEKINVYEKNGEFDKALSLIKENRSKFPYYFFDLSKVEIYLNEKLNKYSDNLLIFHEGHKKGFFYFIDERIPKYKPYTDLSEFESISQEDLKLRNEAIRASKIIYEVVLPKNFSTDRNWPLCLIFHGGGSNLDQVKNHWHSPGLDSAYIKIYFQSYRHYDSKTYGWTTGDPRSDEELRKLFGTIVNSYPIDHSNIIAAGISAGGTFAWPWVGSPEPTA